MFGERVPYVVAAVSARQARARAVAVGISPLEWRVLAVVFELTATYSKLVDRVSARQVGALVYGKASEEVTESQRKRISAALASLGRAEVITYETAKGGQFAMPVIGLPRNVSGVEDVGMPNVSATEDVGAANVSRGKSQRPSRTTRNVPPAQGTTEKGSEKNSEKSATGPSPNVEANAIADDTGLPLNWIIEAAELLDPSLDVHAFFSKFSTRFAPGHGGRSLARLREWAEREWPEPEDPEAKARCAQVALRQRVAACRVCDRFGEVFDANNIRQPCPHPGGDVATARVDEGTGVVRDSPLSRSPT